MPVLFVSALPEESAALAGRARVLHTGAGKVQTAVALAHHLATTTEPVDLAVNAGTAGSLGRYDVGDVAEVAVVSQHDFDVEAISALAGRPLPGGPLELPGPAGATARLATGDRFINDPTQRDRLAESADLVDMEGYAVAAVCERFGVAVWIAKCVSDAADHEAELTWGETLAMASDRLGRWAAQRGLLD